MFGHYTFDKPSEAGKTGDDEYSQVCPRDGSSSPSSSLSKSQWKQPYEPSLAVNVSSDNTSGSKPKPQLDRGGNVSIDNITHRLSDSHLRRYDPLQPPTLSRDSTSTCASTTSYFSPIEPNLEADCRYHDFPSPTGTWRDTISSMTPMTASSAASPLDGQPSRPSPHPRQDARHLRRQISSKFNNDSQNNQAMQTLVEGMVATGTQCNVYTPPIAPTPPVEAPGTNVTDYVMDTASLEVDENRGDDAECESPFIERFLALRRASGTTGIRKSGFPLHSTSTETALRCQHLVRNRPRMRKRPKIHRQSSLATMSTGETSSVGSPSAAE